MGPDNLPPLEELERLRKQIAQAADLDQLKPAFYRVEELIKQYSGDFDVQLAASEIKQRIVARGVELKQRAARPLDDPPLPEPLAPVARDATREFARPIEAGPPLAPSPEIRGPALPPDLVTSGITSGATSGIPPQPVPPSAPPLERPPSFALAKQDPPSAVATSDDGGPKKFGLWIGALLVLIAGALGFAALRHFKTQKTQPAEQAIAVDIVSQPTGAAIVIDGTPRCIANCSARLTPGDHSAVATLEGYEPQTNPLHIDAKQVDAKGDPGKVPQLSFTLQPLSQTIRVVADELPSAAPIAPKAGAKATAPATVAAGQVQLDGATAGLLTDGQLVLERVAPGDHTVHVINGPADLTFHVTLAPGKPPLVAGDLVAKNTTAILVGSYMKQARVTTSSGPLKLALNGQPQPDATPSGVDLTGFPSGEAEITIGKGSAQRSFKDNFPPGPALTIFLKSETNADVLTINTGQNDVHVFINDKELPKRTTYGQLRVPIQAPLLGPVTVRVQKTGFDEPPPQKVMLAKGSSPRLNFKLTLLPEFSAIVITGGTPGAELLLDQRVVGSLGPDGGFRNSSIPPGPHQIQLRRDQFEPKQFTRNVPPGQPLTLSGSDVTLTPIKVAVAPPPPEPKPVAAPPPPAAKAVVAPVKPPSRTGTMANFDAAAAWREQDGIFRHRGAATLTYSILPANGVFSFTIHMLKGGSVFKGGRVHWVVDYVDAKNYGSYELDEDALYLKVVENGKTFDRGKVLTKAAKGQRSWPMQVDITPDRVVVRTQKDGAWVDLDTWNEPGRNFSAGKFGIMVAGDDEVGLSDFRFQGR